MKITRLEKSCDFFFILLSAYWKSKAVTIPASYRHVSIFFEEVAMLIDQKMEGPVRVEYDLIILGS